MHYRLNKIVCSMLVLCGFMQMYSWAGAKYILYDVEMMEASFPVRTKTATVSNISITA